MPEQRHGVWANDVGDVSTTDEPDWVQTVTCWCGLKFGPAPWPDNELEAQIAAHVENPEASPDV